MSAAVGVVVVAAGRSTRLGQDKLFLTLAGRPVLAWTLRAFERCRDVEQVALVLNEANFDAGRALVERDCLTKVRHCCLGGSRRQDSVLAGLLALGNCGWVGIHDGARPLVTPDLFSAGLAAAQATGAAIPGVSVKDTIKVVDDRGAVASTPSRASLRAIQTPQVFRYDLILGAYRAARSEVTDDAALLEALGHPVTVFPGSYDNLKITTADDLVLAEALLRRQGVF